MQVGLSCCIAFGTAKTKQNKEIYSGWRVVAVVGLVLGVRNTVSSLNLVTAASRFAMVPGQPNILLLHLPISMEDCHGFCFFSFFLLPSFYFYVYVSVCVPFVVGSWGDVSL